MHSIEELASGYEDDGVSSLRTVLADLKRDLTQLGVSLTALAAQLKAAETLLASMQPRCAVRDDLLQILGASPNSSQEQIRAAYHAKVRQWHPDQLENMAPELRAYANQELAHITPAHDELSIVSQHDRTRD